MSFSANGNRDRKTNKLLWNFCILTPFLAKEQINLSNSLVIEVMFIPRVNIDNLLTFKSEISNIYIYISNIFEISKIYIYIYIYKKLFFRPQSEESFIYCENTNTQKLKLTRESLFFAVLCLTSIYNIYNVRNLAIVI